jgi:hypothetical protein
MDQMKRLAFLGLILVLAGVLIGSAASSASPVRAQEETPPADKRVTTLKVSYTAHEWWLVRWRGNAVDCRLIVDHEGLPIPDEILVWCNNVLYNEWNATKPCVLTEGQTVEDCPGLYLFEAGSFPAEKEVEVELPLPSVWLSVAGCSPEPPGNRCDSPPNLLLTGEEPLPNETIISIQGVLGSEPFTCHNNPCNLPLRPTGPQGVEMEFWAESSFGDSSPHYTALVRVVPHGDFMSPEQPSSDPTLYYVDVISSQWRGGPLASCSDIWQSFPEVGGPPPWLTTPADPAELYSDIPLYHLAGVLISNGQVDASSCPDGGLLSPVAASTCGMEQAREKVIEWQNQFNQDILQAAKDTGVPAQLLKNVFNRESQFWPGIYSTYKEAGLGQMTEKGADTVLLWNPSFFSQFCPLVLHQDRCVLGFGNLTSAEQAMLRGALVTKVNAACADCPAGIDLTQAQFSVRVFAEGMVGNCQQVGRILTNVAGQTPGKLTSYVDLWRLTLLNYNAGPGCLSTAVQRVFNFRQPFTWENISARLDPACQSAVDYVEDVSKTMSGVQPTPTSWVYPGQTPPGATVVVAPTATPRPVLTRTPAPGAPTPTRTPTSQSYPSQPTSTVPGYPSGPTSTLPGYPGGS